MTILVTGGSGFIGEHAVEKLVSAGFTVKVFDKKKPAFKHKKVKFFKGDILKSNNLIKASKGCTAIVHLASPRSIVESNEKPAFYTKLGVEGTLNSLNAANKNKIKKFVFASSSTVYGNSEKQLQNEKDEKNPVSIYGLTKKIGETYCELYSKLFSIETISLRFFSVYGPKQDFKENNVPIIPLLIYNNLTNKPTNIWNSGKGKRDFVFVEDVAESILKSLKTNSPGFANSYNIGTGKSISIMEIIQIVEKITGNKNKINLVGSKNGDIKSLRADNRKSKKDLNFKANTQIEDGIKKTLSWIEKAK